MNQRCSGFIVEVDGGLASRHCQVLHNRSGTCIHETLIRVSGRVEALEDRLRALPVENFAGTKAKDGLRPQCFLSGAFQVLLDSQASLTAIERLDFLALRVTAQRGRLLFIPIRICALPLRASLWSNWLRGPNFVKYAFGRVVGYSRLRSVLVVALLFAEEDIIGGRRVELVLPSLMSSEPWLLDAKRAG